MTKEKYQKEIELIKAQNNTEIELYLLATEIIQPMTGELSKRYVFNRKKSKKGNIYYGLSSFPDIAILDKELRSFLEDRIVKNQANTTLKEHENQAFEEILILLEDTEVPETLDWSYFAPFDGFKKLLTEMNVNEYQLMIDREGKNRIH